MHKEKQDKLICTEIWDIEKHLVTAIETGNLEMVDELFQSYSTDDNNDFHYGNPVIVGDVLREQKNNMIMLNTICKLAASKGGVPARFLQIVSERHILMIEYQEYPDQFSEKLSKYMITKYTEMVRDLSVHPYNDLIQAVTLYISEHIHEPIALSNIATHFHVNASHLSREFKKETQYNMTDYINQQKMDLAKLFLLQNNYSIMDVSDLLNFNSSSYFSKTFKKITGFSPKEYKNKIIS